MANARTLVALVIFVGFLVTLLRRALPDAAALNDTCYQALKRRGRSDG